MKLYELEEQYKDYKYDTIRMTACMMYYACPKILRKLIYKDTKFSVEEYDRTKTLSSIRAVTSDIDFSIQHDKGVSNSYYPAIAGYRAGRAYNSDRNLSMKIKHYNLSLKHLVSSGILDESELEFLL